VEFLHSFVGSVWTLLAAILAIIGDINVTLFSV
jgi:hypothetical protein